MECIADSTFVSVFAKKIPAGRWSFFGLGPEKKWYFTYIDRPQGEWDRVAELMMIRFGESEHPVFLKSKGGEKLSLHSCVDGDTIETVFRTIISVNQLSTYGAVAEMCEENNTCQTKTERPVLAGQSDPQFAPANLLIMTPGPSIEIPAQGKLLHKHKERVETLPQPDQLIKVCTDAGTSSYNLQSQ